MPEPNVATLVARRAQCRPQRVEVEEVSERRVGYSPCVLVVDRAALGRGVLDERKRRIVTGPALLDEIAHAAERALSGR